MTEYIELRIEEYNGRGVHFYVAGQSRKFKSEAEKEKQQIESALKLQELVKKRAEDTPTTVRDYEEQALYKDLVEESER